MFVNNIEYKKSDNKKELIEILKSIPKNNLKYNNNKSIVTIYNLIMSDQLELNEWKDLKYRTANTFHSDTDFIPLSTEGAESFHHLVLSYASKDYFFNYCKLRMKMAQLDWNENTKKEVYYNKHGKKKWRYSTKTYNFLKDIVHGML